jgi:hypothetical protein
VIIQMKKPIVIASIFGFTLSALSFAQVAVYPSKGQTPAQQQKDESECYQWAKQQTGVDPEALAAQPGQTYEQPRGNAARGAAAGAAIGAIAGNAGAGAAIGGGAGAVRRHRQGRAVEAENQNIESQKQQKLAAFNNAKYACLKGRGYSVQ